MLFRSGCDLETARQRLEGIRARLSQQPFQLRTTPERSRQEPAAAIPLAVTLSIGLTLQGPLESSSEVLQRADRALYDAKQAGRDRIRMAVAAVQTSPAH